MTSQRTRARLIQRLREAGIHDERVLAAMSRVPRHIFIDEALASKAYEDTALPIGHQQTISQPYMVALMTESLLAGCKSFNKILEIGTGSGYQAAVLAQLAKELFTVERIRPLHVQAKKCFMAMQQRNIQARLSRGELGWIEHAPYDGIMVTAAAVQTPADLLEQLAEGGRLIVPTGRPNDAQKLLCLDKTADGIVQVELASVKFVPLIQD